MILYGTYYAPYRVSRTSGKSLRKSPIVWTEPDIKIYNIINVMRGDSRKIITAMTVYIYICVCVRACVYSRTAGERSVSHYYTCIGTVYVMYLFIIEILFGQIADRRLFFTFILRSVSATCVYLPLPSKSLFYRHRPGPIVFTAPSARVHVIRTLTK